MPCREMRKHTHTHTVHNETKNRNRESMLLVKRPELWLSQSLSPRICGLYNWLSLLWFLKHYNALTAGTFTLPQIDFIIKFHYTIEICAYYSRTTVRFPFHKSSTCAWFSSAKYKSYQCRKRRLLMLMLYKYIFPDIPFELNRLSCPSMRCFGEIVSPVAHCRQHHVPSPSFLFNIQHLRHARVANYYIVYFLKVSDFPCLSHSWFSWLSENCQKIDIQRAESNRFSHDTRR